MQKGNHYQGKRRARFQQTTHGNGKQDVIVHWRIWALCWRWKHRYETDQMTQGVQAIWSGIGSVLWTVGLGGKLNRQSSQ